MFATMLGSRPRISGLQRAAVLIGLLLCVMTGRVDAAIGFVQLSYATPQTPQSSVAVTFANAQASGNLNVVVVGWNDTVAAVSNVTDSAGNTYTRAAGPTTRANQLTQSIYYARNIAPSAAGSNVVTVRFSAAAKFADVRIVEYGGIDPLNPVDAVTAGSGSSSTSSTSAVTTTSATVLLFAANTVAKMTAGPGAGFTSRVITQPDGDIVEDRIVTSVGSYAAAASLKSNGAWVMQMVAFRAATGSTDTAPPTAPASLNAGASSTTGMSLTWTASLDNVGVTGYLIERCQGTGCGAFSQVATTGATSMTDSGLSPGTTYGYRVRATDAAGNKSDYSNIASATTSSIVDTELPSAPGGLTATARSGSRIDLAWSAATDNVGVTGYRVMRCQATGAAADCPNFVKVTQLGGAALAFSDVTGLIPSTTYRYQVRALDDAGNIGPPSNDASATTLNVSSGLVAAYSFDEGSGPTAADASGNANQGAVINASWATTGRWGGALAFNGSNSLVSINDSSSLRLSSAMTLEAWINPSVVTSTWRDVIYKGDDNYYLEATSTNGGWPAGGGIFGGTNAHVYSAGALVANTWTHLALTYDGATLRAYKNGVEVASQVQTGAIAASTNPLQIGGDTLYGQYFQGMIDEVRIYSRALSPAEILSDMATPIGDIPTPPANLAASAIGPTDIALDWSPSSSSHGIAGYDIERCEGSGCTNFARIGSASATVFDDTTVTANKTYTYRVRAIDAAGHASPYSNLAQAYAGLSIAPRAVALTASQTQQFTPTVQGSGLTWRVDGIVGGSAAVGTISPAGLYAAPAAPGAHTISATSSDQTQSASATVYITNYAGKVTHHNDNFRTGLNANETVLSPSNVSVDKFGKLFSYAVDGSVFASPLYVANVNVPGAGRRNVVYVATEHNTVYAFDADGRSSGPLWQTSFINPSAGITPVPANDTGECCDIAGEIGITGTPVIDPVSGTLYVVAKTKEVAGSTSNYVQRLHALDIGTGVEKFGGPVVIQASVPGTGSGSQGSQITFDGLRENQRPALLLSNGVVYLSFAAHGDNAPWHGWVLGYDATALQRVMTYNTSPNGFGAGIWQSGGGLAADTGGNIYFVTGNGTFDANAGGTGFANTFVKLSPGGAVVDYFTPHNQSTLNSTNADLGSSGPMLLPDQPGAHPHLVVSAGKNKTIHLVDRDNMGHYKSNNDSQIVQSLVNIFPNGTPEPGNYNSPAYFSGTAYFAPVNDSIMAFRMSNGLLPTAPTFRTAATFPYPGPAIAVSSNGTTNGVLWAIARVGVGPGVLRAYDANNLANELYNSNQAGDRDAIDTAVKFSVPLIANGKVYVGSTSQLTVFGLLP